MIPEIDIAPLFAGAGAARDAVDKQIQQAASEVGFMTITGLPNDVLSARTRRRMLSIFDLADADKRALTRQNFAPENSNVYRGWFPLQDGHPTYKEGIDIGADLVHPDRPTDPSDPLTEHTPMPDLPDWRAACEGYYKEMSDGPCAAAFPGARSRAARDPVRSGLCAGKLDPAADPLSAAL